MKCLDVVATFNINEAVAAGIWRKRPMTVDTINLANGIGLLIEATEEKPSETSFEDLYTKHYRRVYSLCLRMTANVADAEDLAQDVFLQVQRKLASFRGD